MHVLCSHYYNKVIIVDCVISPFGVAARIAGQVSHWRRRNPATHGLARADVCVAAASLPAPTQARLQQDDEAVRRLRRRAADENKDQRHVAVLATF